MRNPSAVSDAPHSEYAGRLGAALRVRYSGLKGAAPGEAIMPIQSCWGQERSSGNSYWSRQERVEDWFGESLRVVGTGFWAEVENG